MIGELRKGYGEEHFDAIFKNDETKIGDGDENTNERRARSTNREEYLPLRPLGPEDADFSNHWHEGSELLEDYRKKTDPKKFRSTTNLRRKLMIKILRGRLEQQIPPEKYVWATGGHSAAAGHGNLFKETYTKVMESAAAGVFESVGLTLEARNYAMGATSSASEMAMCFQQVYGDDVDVFSWDFAMLESRDYLSGRLLHYASRGFLSNQREGGVVPAFVALQEIDKGRKNMLIELNEAFGGSDGKDDDGDGNGNGLAIFVRDESLWKAMKEAVPDTFGLSTEQIDALPEFVRHFKCNGGIETGWPFCKEKKYSEEICPDRLGKANWHPGWKYHAMLGNSMALFLSEQLVGAVVELVDRMKGDDDDDDDNPTDAAALLAKLSKEEDALREKMVEAKASQLPRSYDRVYWYNNTSDNWKDYPEAEKAGLETGSEELRSRWKDFDREALFRGPSLCHTARTPSRIRFDGILTNQPELKGEQVVFGKETYFTGVEDKEFLKSNRDKREANEHVPHHPMQLVYTMHDERETNCGDELAHADYHDFFMAEESEGWTSLTFPNDAEQKAYGYHQNKNKYKGMLVIVRRFCGMGVCEKGFAGIDDYRAGKWEMRVNGVPVTSMAFIGHEAIVLEHSGGIYFEPNGEGRYDLEFKINEPEHFVKISAFVLF